MTRLADRLVSFRLKAPTMLVEKAILQATDRYSALGMDPPDTKTMCQGPCEGIGCYPENDKSSKLWQEAEAKKPTDDGWHFVKCPDCNGTGKQT